MNNFTFLQTPEWQDIYKDAALAEHYVLADARTALFYGRRAVEVMVEWLYAFDPAFRRPYDDKLSTLMSDTSFKQHVPQGVRDKMHALRILGNEAVHQSRGHDPRPVQHQPLVRPHLHPGRPVPNQDEIGELKPGWLPDLSDGVNKAQYRKKVEQFIRANEHAVVIHKIRWAMPLTPEDLEALDELLFSAEEVGSETEFAQVFGTPNNLAEFVRSLVGLDRQAAKQKFATFLDGNTYNSDQIQFVNYIVDNLTRNGLLEPAMLYERPFIDIHDAGPTGLFSQEDASRLVALVREVNESVGNGRSPTTPTNESLNGRFLSIGNGLQTSIENPYNKKAPAQMPGALRKNPIGEYLPPL
jgi:hypothetical protein